MTYVVDSNGITDDVASRYGIAKADLFNLTVYEDPGKGRVERFLNVAIKADAGARRLDRVLETESNLVRVQKKTDGTPDLVTTKPTNSTAQENPSDAQADPTKFKKFTGGADSAGLADATDIIGSKDQKTGMYALEKADLFNLLCMPPDKRDDEILPRCISDSYDVLQIPARHVDR